MTFSLVAVALFLLTITLLIILVFMGMFVSAKLTGFSIDSADLMKVVIGSAVAGLVPTYGKLLSLIVMYVLLRRFSDGKGIIFMMICSAVITMLLSSSMTETIGRIRIPL